MSSAGVLASVVVIGGDRDATATSAGDCVAWRCVARSEPRRHVIANQERLAAPTKDRDATPTARILSEEAVAGAKDYLVCRAGVLQMIRRWLQVGNKLSLRAGLRVLRLCGRTARHRRTRAQHLIQDANRQGAR